MSKGAGQSIFTNIQLFGAEFGFEPKWMIKLFHLIMALVAGILVLAFHSEWA
jgi:hypothetical protein